MSWRLPRLALQLRPPPALTLQAASQKMVFAALPTAIRLAKALVLGSAAALSATVEVLAPTAAMAASRILASVLLRSRLLCRLPPLLLQLHLVLRVCLPEAVRLPFRLHLGRIRPRPPHPAWQCSLLPAQSRPAQCRKTVSAAQKTMTRFALVLGLVTAAVNMDSVEALMASVARDVSQIMGHAQEEGKCRRRRDPCRLLHPP